MTDQDPLGLDGVTKDDSAIVTVGTFDGVHLGHRRIVEYVVSRARETRGASTVVTFDPHPKEVTTGDLVPLLTTMDERLSLLGALGARRIVVIPFTRAFAETTSEAFIREVICGRIGCREIVVGHDHSFGRNRAGGIGLLREAGEELGFQVTTIPPRQVGDTTVSSSAIRQRLIESGHVGTAADLLGRRYGLRGRVVHGDGRGRSIGFPTANLEIVSTRKVIPKRGVYAVTVKTTDDKRLRGGMMNIGVRPTFGGTTDVHLEVHVLDFDDDLYGQSLHIEFVERLRDEHQFGSRDELVEQLSSDRERCRQALGGVS